MRDLEAYAGYVLDHVMKRTLSAAMVREFTAQCNGIIYEEMEVKWTGKVKELWDYLTVSQSMSASETTERDKVFLLGRLYAAMEIVKISQDEMQLDHALRVDAREYSRHWYRIFHALKDGKSLTHRELAMKSGISDSSLSQFLHKIEDKKYIHFRKVGRTKYYRLTGRGKELLENMERLKQERSSQSFIFKDYPRSKSINYAMALNEMISRMMEERIVENSSRNEYLQSTRIKTEEVIDEPYEELIKNRYRVSKLFA